MFNVLRLVPLALFIVFASSTTLLPPRARSIDGALTVARAPVASIEEPVFHPVRETNAKRMARGLNPATPNFNRASILPGRGHIPTRMGSARRSTPSSSASITGTIKVTRAGTGELVGYVKKTYSSSSTVKKYGLTTNTADALQVTLLANQNSYTTIDLLEPNPTDSAHPYLGAAVGTSSPDNLSSGSSSYAVLTGTSHTGADAPPSTAGNSYNTKKSESAIWTYSTSTQKITAQWVNPDNSKPNTFLFYLPSGDSLLFTGDVAALTVGASGGYQVEYTLV